MSVDQWDPHIDVDLSVNYYESTLTTIRSKDDQVFSIDSDADGVYGTYTFEALDTGGLENDPLASVSADCKEGDSYAAILYQVDDGYAFAVYEDDFSPSAACRLEIRHTGLAGEIEWKLEPNEYADPDIPVDERRGTLKRGEWQQANKVTENEYHLEIFVDGEVVAYRP